MNSPTTNLKTKRPRRWLGKTQGGRMVMVKQLLINASREGARLAVLPGATNAEVLDRVSNELTAYAVNGVNIQIQPATLTAAAAGTPVTVSLDVEAASVSWIPTPLFSFNQTLRASTTMRKESM